MTITQRCIHQALDLDWCDCPEDVRAECGVTLPHPEDLAPCEHYWHEWSGFVLCLMCGVELDNG